MEFRRSSSLTKDALLTKLVSSIGPKNWKTIAMEITTKTPVQCSNRWKNNLDPTLIKGSWTADEDNLLKIWVANHGPSRWSQCSNKISGRTGKQCRERWFNTVNPNINKEVWTISEDYLIFSLYEKIQGKWAVMVPFFVGRSENNLKNRFHSCLRRSASLEPKFEGNKTSILLQSDLQQ